jgi:hypothetical protein
MSENGTGWENVGRIHTVPLNDLHPHSLCSDCACMPKVEVVDESRVLQIVHNAFDGRDFQESENARVTNLKDSIKAIEVRT